MKESIKSIFFGKSGLIAGLAVGLAAVFGLSSAYLPGPLLVAGIIFLLATVFIFRRPWLGFLLVVFFLPFERLGAYELSETTIRLSQVFFLATVVAWFFSLLINKKYSFAKNPAAVPLLLFLAVSLFSVPAALNPGRSLTVFLYVVFTASLAFFTPNWVTTRRQLRKVVIVLLASFVLVSAFGLFQFFGDMTGLPPELTGLRELYTKDVLGFTRVQSTAYEPLYFANYLLIPIAIIFALFLSGRDAVRSGWLIALFGLGAVNLVLTVSRGGYLAAAAVLLVVGIFYLRRLLTVRNLIIFSAGAALAAVIVIQALGVSGDFFTTDKFTEHVTNAFYGASYDERVETFDRAASAWRENPWFGIGLGGFGPYAASHPYYQPKDGWQIVNNEFIELLAETGVVGLGCFLTLIVVLLARSIKAIRQAKDSYLRAIMVALLAAFIGVLAQYQTFSTLYIMHVWVLIGLMVATQNIIFYQKIR